MMGPSIGRPRFLTVEEALAQQTIAMHQYGGRDGIRDMAALESAIAMPQQAFGGNFAHAFPLEMAASYAFCHAKNQPFVDGNKRVALLCCVIFLRMNGWNLASEGTDAANSILSLLAGETDLSGFARWLAEHSRCRPTLELRDFFSDRSLGRMLDVEGSIISASQEYSATLRDAIEHLPIIAELIELERDAERANQERIALKAREAIFVFSAIHRIAEDMGDEW